MIPKILKMMVKILMLMIMTGGDGVCDRGLSADEATRLVVEKQLPAVVAARDAGQVSHPLFLSSRSGHSIA